MQKAQYEAEAQRWSVTDRNAVVGSFDAHNAWPDYEYLWECIPQPMTGLRALDFGCGPGRNLVQYAGRFAQIDGVDIAPTNLRHAAAWLAANGRDPAGCTLYESNGVDLAAIPSATYDVVFSTIALQHICVYAIRRQLLHECVRVLKPGGWLTVQMGYGVRPGAVGYYVDHWLAQQTNAGCDVQVDDPHYVAADCFEAGAEAFRYRLGPTGPGDAHAAWLYWTARKVAA